MGRVETGIWDRREVKCEGPQQCGTLKNFQEAGYKADYVWVCTEEGRGWKAENSLLEVPRASNKVSTFIDF